MVEHITNSLSVLLRLSGLVLFVPVLLAGCGSSGAGGSRSLGSNASFGLANEDRAYVPSKSISYRSTVTRPAPAVRQAKKKPFKKIKIPKKVETAKLQKRLPRQARAVAGQPVSRKKIESRMAMITTNRSARLNPPAIKIKKPAAARKIVWKKKAANSVSANPISANSVSANQVLPRAKPSAKNAAAQKPAQMVPEKAIAAQISLAAMEKSLNDLSKEAARDEEATQKEQLKRTAKVAPAPVTFGFGQIAHRFSGQ